MSAFSEQPDGPQRTRVRPGGRSERIREAVLRACLDLLVEGKVELPMAEVAERSGVNRGTVYRWWPTQAELLMDAVAFHWDYRIDAPDTGSWEGDVREVVTQLARLVDEPVERAIMVTMITGRYPTFNGLLMDTWRRVLPDWFAMVGRAVGRGEVSADVDPRTVLSLMMAPIMSLALFSGAAPEAPELEALTQLVCRATAAEPPADA